MEENISAPEEKCSCGHEHHHHEEECCGHEHHHHEGECCGHEHHHEDGCCCGHEHAGKAVRKVFLMENLDCAHCAAKIEEKINAMPQVENATITFSTKQLRVTAEDPDSLLEEMTRIARSVEGEVVIRPRDDRSSTSKKRVYILHNLDCAHCAAKIESKIAELPGVEEVTITFSTRQLRLTAENPDALLPRMLEAARSVEADVDITAREEPHPQPGCCRNQQGGCKKRKKEEQRNSLQGILIGAVLFVAGLALEHMNMPMVTLAVCVAAYTILGYSVVRKAVMNLIKGNTLDENFLMAVASIGAFFVGNYPEAVGVMLFYRVGEYFEDRAVEKSRSQIMDAVDLRPEVVNCLEGEEIRVIPAADARIGDLLLVRPGDRIPLDGVVTQGESRIDTAPITGEPVPVAVRPGNAVISGCVNTVGQLTIRVEKELSESMVTRILDSVENAAASKPKIDRFITRFARVYTPIVVVIAVLTAVIPSLITGNWSQWIYTALTFLVMSCPCALVLSVPLAFFAGIGAGSKKGILFKGGTSMEALKEVRSVIMDKTGTITRGDFRVQKAEGDPDLLRLCASCEQRSTHPIAVSIVTAAREQGLELTVPQNLEEIAGQGIRAVCDGRQILCGNEKLMQANGIAFTPEHTAGTQVLVAVDGSYAGYLVIDDTLKEDAESAISKLKASGVFTVMLTGDSETAAKAVAARAGVDQVHAGLLPNQKLEYLQKIRQQTGTVMFVGDGINDAPVLAGADVGAAMGSGADAAIEAADVVFMTSEMEAIPQALEIARSTGRIAWGNVIFALAVKFAVIVLGFCGIASMWLAVFADTGVAMICILNSIRLLYRRK